MDENQTSQQPTADTYRYAATLYQCGKNSYEVKTELLSKGFSEEDASSIADNMEQQVIAAKKSKANKDMLYGGLWFAGGLILTLAHTGFIFWGAIVFGAIQFFRGVANS